MNPYFSDKELSRIVRNIGKADVTAFRDEESGCDVTYAVCDDCLKVFDEELEVAKYKMIARETSLCLSCDPLSQISYITAVRMTFSARVCF